MSPRSKWLRASLFVVPLVLVALLWNAARGRPRFVATPVPAQALALSSDGKRLAFSIQSEEVFWKENGPFHKLPSQNDTPGYPPFGSPPTLAFAPDSNAIYRTNNNTPHVFRWDLSGDRIHWSAVSPNKQSNQFSDFAVSRDGRRVAQRLFDVVKVFDVTGAGKPQKSAPGNDASRYARTFPVLFRQKIGINTQKGGETYVSDIALSDDGSLLIVAEPRASLQFWNVSLGKLTLQTTEFPFVRGTNMTTVQGAISQLTPSPDGRFVALCDDIGVALWSFQTRKWTRPTPTTVVAIHQIQWMPDSRSLWTSSWRSNSDADKVQQLSVPELKPLRVLPAWGPFAVAGDGRTVATRDNAQKGIWLWNLD